MDYQILINGNPIFSGDIYIVAFISILILSVLVVLIRIIWGKLKSNEDLKYEFITIIAHKFRTPLTQSKWILEELLTLEGDSYKKESLNNLGTSNSKLINLTNTLVELTDSSNHKLAAYNFERINICELVGKVVGNLDGDFHRKNIFYGVQFSEPEIFVRVDRQRMEFVIQTMIENSITYTETGKNVDIIVVKKGRKAIVQVTDNGIGIDASQIKNVFSKFYRSKEAQTMDTEGFGVNLFLAKSVVKRHRGKIEAMSEGLGSGSTFSLTLKRVR
jgi:signal transduction histidine kinase